MNEVLNNLLLSRPLPPNSTVQAVDTTPQVARAILNEGFKERSLSIQWRKNDDAAGRQNQIQLF